MAIISERAHSVDFASPFDRVVRKGINQDSTEVAAQHLGTCSRAVVGFVEEHGGVLIEYARRGAARVDDRAELVGEAGSVERGLTVVFVDVELAALRASFCRRFRLVDLRGNSVNVEYTRESQTAEARPDDRYRVAHVCFLSSFDWNAVPITILERRSRYVKMVRMATRNQRTERRTDALSKERIVEAAIEILDDEGEAALTFRALSARLATGRRGDLLARCQQERTARRGDRRRHRPRDNRCNRRRSPTGGDPDHHPRRVRRDRRPPLGRHPTLT